MVRNYLKDTADRTSEILTALSNTGDISFEYRKLALLDAKGLNTEAEQVLDLMQSMEKDELEQENLQDYIEVCNLLKTWKQNDVNMSRLDSNAIDMLKPFALNNNKAAAMAISVLKQNGQSAAYFK